VLFRSSIVGIAEYVKARDPSWRRKLGSTWWCAPDESTFRRAFARIDAAELDRHLGAWMSRHVDLSGAGIAIDGKAARGSRNRDTPAVHLVSAVLHRDGWGYQAGSGTTGFS